MQEYGEPIGGFNPVRDTIYSDWVKYYDNPSMTKIKDVYNFSMYMTKTHCLLSKECRYLIAIVDKDTSSVGTQEQLQNLHWKSFQTRTLEDKHELHPHFFTPKSFGVMASKLTRTETEHETSTYKSKELPITVIMIHEKPGHSEYYDTGNLAAALETYSTIIELE